MKKLTYSCWARNSAKSGQYWEWGLVDMHITALKELSLIRRFSLLAINKQLKRLSGVIE
jgi:hypothetical protein